MYYNIIVNKKYIKTSEVIKMTHTTLKQVRHDRWEDNNGNYIWRDDFGAFIIYVNGTMERTDSLQKALEVMDSDRYWN
jgi:hypothetical protein